MANACAGCANLRHQQLGTIDAFGEFGDSKITTSDDYDEDECRHLVNGTTTPAALPCHLFVQSSLSAITGRRTDKGARPNFTSLSLSLSSLALSYSVKNYCRILFIM